MSDAAVETERVYLLDLDLLPQVWEQMRAGDKRAEEYLVIGYMWLAKKLAAEQQVPAYMDRQDLVSWASRGLLEAVRRFDPGQSDGALHKHFAAFAAQRIRGAILDGLKSPQTSWAPRSEWRKVKMQKEVEGQLAQAAGRPVTRAEIADAMGIDTVALAHLREQTPASPDMLLELNLPGREEPEREVVHDDMAARVAACLARLAPVHQRVLHDIIVHRRSLGALAKDEGVSVPQVRAMCADALVALRLELRG